MVQIRLTVCSAHVLSHFSCVWLFVAPWTIASQAPLSVGFSRQEHWSGLPCFPPGDLPDPGIESVSLLFPAFQADSLPVTLHYPSKWLSPYQYSMNYIFTPMTTYFCSEILYTTEKSWHATTEKQNKNNNTKPFPNAAFFSYYHDCLVCTNWQVHCFCSFIPDFGWTGGLCGCDFQKLCNSSFP